MAISKTGLKAKIIAEMETAGANASGQHSWVDKLATAIANAVVDEIKNNAVVPVPGGSSAGNYPVT